MRFTSSWFAPGTDRRTTQLVLADQGVVSGANFLIGLLLARALGPSGYGQFTLIFNVVLFVLGIQAAIIQFPMMVIGATVSVTRSAEYFAAVIMSQLALCFAAGLLFLCSVPLLRNLVPHWGMHDLAWPLLLGMSGYLLQDFCRRYLFLGDRAGWALMVDLVTHGSRFVLLAWVSFSFQLTAGAALLVFGATAAMGIALTVWVTGWQALRRWPTRAGFAHTVKSHWNVGKWLIAESLAYWCGSQLALYVAANVLPLSAVGAITAAMNIVAATHVLLLALENVVPARAARAYANHGAGALNHYLWRVGLQGGAGTLAIIAIAVLGAEYWLDLLYGQEYVGNGRLIAWWGMFYALGFAQRPLSVGLRVLGNTRAIFHATLAGAVVAIAASYPMTRALGEDGTLLTLCLVQAAVLSCLIWSYRTTLHTREACGTSERC